jgi:putative aminopeptidase FrvX
METVALLRDLSMSTGLSGYEQEPREITRRAMAPYADEFRVDALGNLIAIRRGQRPADEPARGIMLAAHTDEIGLMVTGHAGSFLRFACVGGVDVRTIVGQEVVVHGRRDLPGIIASRPPHVVPPEERRKAIPIDNLYIDVGLTEQALREAVQIGDLVSMRREVIELAEGYLSGKSFDDRAGVVSLARCLELLAGMRHTWDVFAVATTQEEVGLRGAMVSAFGLGPDLAIAVDVGFGKQQGVSDDEAIAMDGGPAVALGPNVHPLLHQRLVETAKANELKYQVEAAPGATGTDAWAIQVAREGIPAALLSIPLRYMHTSVETVCARDIDRTARLMALTIAGLDEAFAAQMGL